MGPRSRDRALPPGERAPAGGDAQQRAQRSARAPCERNRDATQELREAEAKGNRLPEQSRHQATELTNSARAEVEQILEWARAQAAAILSRAQSGTEQPEPEREPEPEPEHEPEPERVVSYLPVSDTPREWNLWELERAARDHGGDDVAQNEERSYLLMYLREFAGHDGILPADFGALVRESFGDVLHRVA